MMVWSINLLVLAIGILLVGMIKPYWILFWMEKPGRFPIVLLSIVLFMVSATMFGQANIEKHRLKTEQTQQKSQTEKDTLPSVTTETAEQTKQATELKQPAPIAN